MRRLRDLNAYRRRDLQRLVCARLGLDEAFQDQDLGGVFVLPSPSDGAELRIHAGAGDGWDHVSVSRPHRTPSWTEMEHVKRLFFRDDEVAYQLHVPARDHINQHAYCLHLWRPIDVTIPMPPAWMV